MDSITLSLTKSSVGVGDTFYANVAFFQGGSPDTPTSVQYRIDVISPGKSEVRTWTDSVPFSTTSFSIESSDTQLAVFGDPRETFQVTVKAIKGGTTLTKTANYVVSAVIRLANLGYKVTTRDFSWLEMVSRQWGSEYRAPDHRIYEFSNGRGFDSTDIGQTGIYRRR